MVPYRIEHKVIAPLALCEVLLGVINNMIGADRPHHVYISCAADGRHLSAKRLGYLYRECPDPSRRAIDQYLVPRLNPSPVTQTLQGSACRHVYGSSLFKRDVGRFSNQ